MADEPVAGDAPVASDDQNPEANEAFDPDRAKEKIRKANSEAENLRKRLKELEPLAKRAQELEDAQKTEQEKLTEANRSLEERARKAEIDLCRYRVAMRKGLTETQARRLVGGSEEELEADADELLEAFNAKAEPPASGGRPKERLRPGAVPDAEPDPDPKDVLASIPRF